MAYRTHDRNASGIMFFGASPSDQAYESNSNFTYDGSTMNVPNITISNGGNLGSVGDPDALSIASNGNVSLSQDLSVAGNLTVNGTTTTVNSTVVTIEDPIIILGSGSPTTDDNKDRGISFNWHNGSAAKTGFFGFDDSTGKFTFVPDATIASEVVTGSAGIIVADIEGDLTGNADTATALETARNFSITGEVVASNVSFNGTSNVQLSATLANSAVTAQTELAAAPDAANDFLLIYDASATELKKITTNNLVSGLGTMSSFTISDGTTTQQIDDGETVTFDGGTTVNFTVSATNNVAAEVVENEIQHDNLGGFVANEHINHSSVNITAGNGLTGGGDITASRTLNVGAGSLIDVAADTVSVDLTEANAAAIADGDYLIFLDGGLTGAASKTSTDELASMLAGDGLEAKTDSSLSVGVGTGIQIDGTSRVALDFGSLSSTTLASGDSFGMLDSDGVTHQTLTVSNLGAYLAGDNLTAGGDGKLNFSDADVEGVIFTAANFVDSTRINFTVTTGQSVTADLIANTISETYLTASVAGDGLSGGNGSALSVNVDDTTIETSSDTLRVKAGGIDTAQLADGAVTEAKRSRTVTAISSTAIIGDDINLCTAGAGGITVTLPAPATGKKVVIKKVDSGAGAVTISRNSTDTIDGGTTAALYYQYESMTLVSDGTNWFIV